MSVQLVVAMAVAGVFLIVLVVHLLGGSDEATLSDAAQAVSLLEEHDEGVEVEEVTLDTSRHAALLSLREDERVGFVRVLGRKHVVEVLGRGAISRLERPAAAALELHFVDVGLKPRRIDFEQPELAERWHARLAHLSARGLLEEQES